MINDKISIELYTSVHDPICTCRLHTPRSRSLSFFSSIFIFRHLIEFVVFVWNRWAAPSFGRPPNALLFLYIPLCSTENHNERATKRNLFVLPLSNDGCVFSSLLYILKMKILSLTDPADSIGFNQCGNHIAAERPYSRQCIFFSINTKN